MVICILDKVVDLVEKKNCQKAQKVPLTYVPLKKGTSTFPELPFIFECRKCKVNLMVSENTKRKKNMCGAAFFSTATRTLILFLSYFLSIY
jgi:hypothetical protein